VSRRAVVILVLLVGVLGALGVGAYLLRDQFTEEYERTVFTPPTGRAAVDPYYALALLLEARGHEVLAGPVEKDDEIDAYDVAFWLADEAPSVDFFYRARGEILVISEMHFPRADASLAVAVRAEDGERPSQIRLADESPYWDLVVVVPTTEHFSNSRLEGWSESRRTLAEVLHFISEESKITLLRSTEPRSFLHFLLEHGLSAVILFAALLLLLVARTLLRVGPVLTPPLPGHRSFVEYLEAVGHFARRRGGEKKLLEAARAEVLARFVKRRPELASLEGDALVLALSEHVALDRETIARALRDDPRGHPRAFVDVMNALQELRKAP
jgi:hypothetical protein